MEDRTGQWWRGWGTGAFWTDGTDRGIGLCPMPWWWALHTAPYPTAFLLPPSARPPPLPLPHHHTMHTALFSCGMCVEAWPAAAHGVTMPLKTLTWHEGAGLTWWATWHGRLYVTGIGWFQAAAFSSLCQCAVCMPVPLTQPSTCHPSQ